MTVPDFLEQILRTKVGELDDVGMAALPSMADELMDLYTFQSTMKGKIPATVGDLVDDRILELQEDFDTALRAYGQLGDEECTGFDPSLGVIVRMV